MKHSVQASFLNSSLKCDYCTDSHVESLKLPLSPYVNLFSPLADCTLSAFVSLSQVHANSHSWRLL
jgi:hypothetical protein